MTRPQIALVLHALVLIAALVQIVPVLTETLGGPRGFLLSLLVDWLGFCLPVIFFPARRRSACSGAGSPGAPARSSGWRWRMC